jgi:hypothetical protein
MGKPTSNAKFFGVLMIITQIALGGLHGVFIRPA